MTTCRASDGNGFTCTDKRGHKHEHVAEGADGEVWSMWANDEEETK
ncbi:hypothetical protein [Pseudonocardia spinosispora]|nr:hypothetical protein [Pseudonocardia spinosispora]